LLHSGLIRQHRTKRWAYYTLAAPLEIELSETKVVRTDEERILEYVKKVGSINNEDCRKLLSIDLHKASNMLKKMKKHGVIVRKGERRWARYFLS